MPTLTLFHTAQVHCATFDAIRNQYAPDVELVHHVREDWLATAIDSGITQALRGEIAHTISHARGQTLCTCSSIGEVAEEFGAQRIDRPLMEEAAQTTGDILLAYTAESTEKPSGELLEQAREKFGHKASVHLLCIPEARLLFEAGKMLAFSDAIENAVRLAVRNSPMITCVILAQVSMTAAAQALKDIEPTILTSPALAFMASLRVARSQAIAVNNK